MEGDNENVFSRSREYILSSIGPRDSEDKSDNFSRIPGHFVLRVMPLVIFCFFMFSSAVGIITIFPQYVMARMGDERNFSAILGNRTINACEVNKSDPAYQINLEIQQESAEYLAIGSFFTGVPCVISVIILGALSDKVGRKKVIYVSFVGQLVFSVGVCLLVTLDLPLWVYFPVAFIYGCCGAQNAMFAAVYAFIADVTEEHERPLAIVMVDISNSVSMIVMNLALGAIVNALGYLIPSIVLACLTVVSIFFVMFAKESVPVMENTNSCQVLLSPFKSIKELLYMSRRRSVALILLTIGHMFYSLILASNLGINTLYLLGVPFCWNPFELGIYNAVSNLGFMTFAFLVIKLLRKKVDRDFLILAGLISFCTMSVLQGTAAAFRRPESDIFMSVGAATGVLATLPNTMIRSQASMLATSDEQGAVFGLLSTGEAFAFSFGSPITNAIYSATVSVFTGLVFYFCAAILLLSIVFIAAYKIAADPLSECNRLPMM